MARNKSSQSLKGGSQIRLQLKGYVKAKTLLEDIQLDHSYTVMEISFDFHCCQKFGKKKKSMETAKLKKNKDRNSQVIFYLGNFIGSYNKKAEFADKIVIKAFN